MTATHLNPRLDQTAARHLAKAMSAVHPSQRRELVLATLRHGRRALEVMDPPADSLAALALAQDFGLCDSDVRALATATHGRYEAFKLLGRRLITAQALEDMIAAHRPAKAAA